MKPLRVAVVSAAAFLMMVPLATSAQAGPSGGCGEDFEVKPVQFLLDLTSETPDDVVLALDKNGDGRLCIKFLPEPAAPKVAAHDNTTQHNQ